MHAIPCSMSVWKGGIPALEAQTTLQGSGIDG